MTYAGLWFDEPKDRELFRKLEDLSSINHWPMSTTIKKGLSQFLEDHYPNFPPQPPSDASEDDDED